MGLSKRLKRVAENVQSGGVVADVGCDHGFTSIYLVQQHIAAGAIAMDINEGPLKRATEHIEQYGMSGKIYPRLSDGLKKLEPGEADTILISGLGGALMARILEQGRGTTAGATELVLSPQSEPFLVRRKVHELGFAIAHEEMVEDQKKFYLIIRAVPGEEKYREREYFYGRKLIEERDRVFQEFLRRELDRLAEVERHMEQNKLSSRGRERWEECLHNQENIRKILNKIKC